VNGGHISITKSYEGIESAVITINSGDIHIVASDDGINGAGGKDASGMNPGMRPGGQPGRGGPGQDTFSASSSIYLHINGGYIVVTAAGDGVDINGAIEMTDGVLIVNGPTERMNGALDYDVSFKMSGGIVVAAGSSGMAQVPSASSSQYSVLINLTSIQKAGTLFHIQDSSGKEILTFAPSKDYQSVAFSSPLLVKGATYQVLLGGSASGTVKDGLYQQGTSSNSVKYTSFTISSIVTNIGSGGGRP
jgi:hypothetical protein